MRVADRRVTLFKKSFEISTGPSAVEIEVKIKDGNQWHEYRSTGWIIGEETPSHAIIKGPHDFITLSQAMGQGPPVLPHGTMAIPSTEPPTGSSFLSQTIERGSPTPSTYLRPSSERLVGAMEQNSPAFSTYNRPSSEITAQSMEQTSLAPLTYFRTSIEKQRGALVLHSPAPSLPTTPIQNTSSLPSTPLGHSTSEVSGLVSNLDHNWATSQPQPPPDISLPSTPISMWSDFDTENTYLYKSPEQSFDILTCKRASPDAQYSEMRKKRQVKFGGSLEQNSLLRVHPTSCRGPPPIMSPLQSLLCTSL